MKERYFDDLKTGDRFKSEPLNVTVKEVVEFAHKFDPQMFHLSRRRAERSIFKGLIASGWHTAAMSMRLFVKTLNFAEGAIGLGVDELRWPNAVRPGDVLTVDTEILELRRLTVPTGPWDSSLAQRDDQSTWRSRANNAGERDGAKAGQRPLTTRQQDERTMRGYTKIKAWRLADDLTVSVYEHTFPKEETYGLTSQLRRAAYSVPANVVEGALRETKRDYLHFLYIARGSLAETQYCDGNQSDRDCLDALVW